MLDPVPSIRFQRSQLSVSVHDAMTQKFEFTVTVAFGEEQGQVIESETKAAIIEVDDDGFVMVYHNV